MIKSESVDLILTDPPYGIRYRSQTDKTIKNDKAPYIWWLYDAYRILKNDGALLCFTRWDVLEAWRSAIQYAGFTIRSCIVWDKVYHGMGNTKAAFAPQHELLLFADKGGYRFPGRRPTDVLSYRKVPSAHMIHPTQKPVELLCALIEFTTRRGAIVCDPFAGSGSTIEACARTGRNYIAIELEAEYCIKARERINAQKEELNGNTLGGSKGTHHG